MDKEQENLEFLGFIGILKESLKIISTHPKIFTKITLAFILPLTFIVLANNEIYHLLSNNNTSHHNNSKWILYWGVEAAYFIFIFVIIFSLLSISAVVYTAASIYTGNEVSYKQVMRAIPSVWKRLVITLLSNICIVIAYMFIVAFLCLIIVVTFISLMSSKQNDAQTWLPIVTTLMAILLFAGLIYTSIFWQLANVISVMENHSGFKAMNKSRQLIKGRLGCAIAIMLVLSLGYVPLFLLNRRLFRNDTNVDGIEIRILCIILRLVLNPLVTLYSLVVQTVFYCVCKSYHHEAIDKSTLANHLEELRGDYVPLLSEVVEIV